MFRFRFEGGSGVPPYLQLVQQVERAVRLGELRAGDRLPTVKEVAAGMVINPNTVLKAYRELEHRGLAKGRPGKGTFVEREFTGLDEEKRAELRAGLTEWLTTARRAGMDPDDIAALVSAALHDLREENP
ncbi:GntR family transcriptional regulator [Prauserella marina]|uniref:GntR family transcriptional regulator n=1 Tax=Prauserella marina TaxID=530584 RepID=A0A1G6QN03_9PSEU|nr:GntR family transcriptional regulator [Prauserella marina]PWV78766.1 GntR family transcriptional regulator [Prauserella marina]SDC93126.1 GntR family transcriptional regulator [Prauserella marina]